eukprot:c26503_g1_i1 orf=90-302(-)
MALQRCGASAISSLCAYVFFLLAVIMLGSMTVALAQGPAPAPASQAAPSDLASPLLVGVLSLFLARALFN